MPNPMSKYKAMLGEPGTHYYDEPLFESKFCVVIIFDYICLCMTIAITNLANLLSATVKSALMALPWLARLAFQCEKPNIFKHSCPPAGRFKHGLIYAKG
jgi:hypothetical protein